MLILDLHLQSNTKQDNAMNQIKASQLYPGSCEVLEEALLSLDTRIRDWVANREQALDVLTQVFAGGKETETSWRTQLDELIRELESEGLEVPLELVSDASLSRLGVRAGYVGRTNSEAPRILVDKKWLNSATVEEVVAVLLEELGHAIDDALNGGKDTSGDEGEIFSALLLGVSAVETARDEDDQRKALIHGRELSIEASGEAMTNQLQAVALSENIYSPISANLNNSSHIGKIYSTFITGSSSGGGVWGSGIYTIDSSLSVAAVHAGRLTAGQQGTVYLKLVTSLPNYTASTANGVTTSSYGPYGSAAYQFVDPPSNTSDPSSVQDSKLIPSSSAGIQLLGTGLASASQANTQNLFDGNFKTEYTDKITGQIQTVKLSDNIVSPISANLDNFGNIGKIYTANIRGSSSGGGVWGSGTYTIDSSLSVAAVHAGKLTAGQQGTIYIKLVPSLPNYTASSANGVTTFSYGPYGSTAYQFVDAPTNANIISLAGVAFSYQNPTIIKSLRLATSAGSTDEDPKNLELYGKETDGKWTRITSVSLDTQNVPNTRETLGSAVNIVNTTAYLDYRLTFSATKNPAASNARLGDIQLFGQTVNATQKSSLKLTAIESGKNEGDAGTTSFTFSVTRQDNTSETSSASWGVTGSSSDPATATDFANATLPSGTVSFAPGETSKTVTISVLGDSKPEEDEEFSLTLTNPSSNTIIALASATGVIRNDDIEAISLQMTGPGSPALVFTGTPVGNLETQGLQALVGRTSNGAALYGMQNVAVKIIEVDETGTATIEGSGLWGGKNQTFTGELVKEGDGYSLKSVDGSVDLGRWLGSTAHFQNHTNGTITLKSTGAAPAFTVEGVAQMLLDPDAASKAAPFTAKLNNFTVDQAGIKDFTITPTDLSTPLSIKLGEAKLQLGRDALRYTRDADNNGYTLGLGVSNGSKLTIADADTLELDGTLLFGGRLGANNTIKAAPTRGNFEIVNTTPFRIANTEFGSIGGLRLTYQEDDQRLNGVLAVNGSNTVNLERLKDVAVTLGVNGFGLADAMRSASQTLAPTLWTLGSIDDRSTAQTFDLGLVKIEDVDLGGLNYINRSKPGNSTSVDLDKGLVESLGGAGLFKVAPLYPTLQDRFTIYDLNGKAISEVVLDISGTAESSALMTVSRTQQLSNQEKLTLYSKKKAADEKKSEGEVSVSFISDLFTSPNTKSDFDTYTDYFKATSQNGTQYGSVNVDAKGQWSYTLDQSKLDQVSKEGLGNPNFFRVTPRINIATGLSAELKEIDTSISALFAGMKSQATMALKFLEPISPLVELLEKEVGLTGLKGIDNALLSMLEVVPDNAYKDGKLQVIELLDTASYLQSMGKRQTITPFFKQLGSTIRALKAIAKTSSLGGSTEVNKLDLGLLFRSDLTQSDPYQWLYSSLVDPANSQTTVLGEIAKLASDTQAETSLTDREKAKKAKPTNKTVKGKTDKSVSVSVGGSLSVDIPALYEPTEFLASFLTDDLLTLFSLEAQLNLGLEGSIKIPTGIPLVSALLGLEASLALGLSLISTLSSDELELLGDKIRDIQKTVSDTTEQTKQIAALVGKAAKEGMGTDLSKNTLAVSLEPYVGIVLGIPNYNISGRLGIYFDYELGTERQIVKPDGTVEGSDDGVEQRIKFSDYYGDRPSGSYSYDPTLGSLRLDLNHNYDFLLAKGTLDTTRFASFEEAYGRNSWLLNLQIEPINLRSLIGISQVSYDKTLLEKLGDKLIDRVDWINIAGSSLVTSRGVDLFFADAKFLNSPASNALRDALKRQYSSLTDKELARLLSLIVDYGKPTRVSYALTDAQAVDARINAMKSVSTVRSASSVNAAVAPTDRFRLRYEENGEESAVDSYLYYGLAQAKYIEINPKLTTNYASVDFDLISEGSDIELELHFYDGSRWRPLGNIVDTLSGTPTIRLANGSIESIGLNYKETAKTDPDRYVHNSGTLTIQMALVQMDRPGATEDEKLLRDLANRGELQLRLSDSGTNSSQVTFSGAPRVERGGAIHTKAVDSGAVLRQAPTTPWSSELASGTVQWLMPSFFRNLAERSDLAFLNSTDKTTRTAGIVQDLNPQAPLAVQLALQQLEGRSSSHISASQSGTLASSVEGVMRFTNDPISNQAYKSYIGADGQVRIAARSFDGQDWLDIATLGNLQLNRGEQYAPDLVALDGQLVVASWNSAGALVTYLIDPKAVGGPSLLEVLPTSVSLDKQGNAETGDNQWGSAASTPKSNKDLQIGLEKRLDLSPGSTSLRKAFYLSVLDPIQQVYASSGQALKLEIDGYDGVANTKTLLNAAQAWANPDGTKGQLRSLLGFGEKSSQGLFSGKQPGNALASVRGAAFMEYASAEQLAAQLRDWGSGSVFVVVGDAAGNAMVWNFDGDACTRTNANRSKPETVLSSGRVYNLAGVVPDGLSVVYKPTDQKDALVSNWAGLVDTNNADYRQVPGQLLRRADLHNRDDLVAGGNVSLLITGVAKGHISQVQAGFNDSQLGNDVASLYKYADGTPILRYFSSERMADANGVYHWFDAGNVAPLELNAYDTSKLSAAQKATASLNSGGTLGGLGWIWTSANPLSRGRLDSLESNSGLGFADANSLNLAITGNNWKNQLGSSAKVNLQPGSIQLLPTNQTPELFFSGQSATADLNLSLTAGARSEVAVVLQGNELLNPERLGLDRALTATGILQSFFSGDRPFLSRGDYVPLGYYRDGDRIFYGNLQAPVEVDAPSTLDPKLFAGLASQAVTPLGFEGAIADYITYGVKQPYGSAVLKLIQNMPSTVDSNYFQFVDNNFNPLNIGNIIHGPMVPLFGAGGSNQRQVIVRDLTPWSPDQASLYVQGLKDITLGRGEPDSVVLEQMRLVGTYTEAAQSLQSFVAYAWNDPILKYGLLDGALPVGPFRTSEDWLTEFRKSYTGIDIPQALDLVSPSYPTLVNNTLFSPIAADAVVSNYLPLPFKGPGTTDQLVLNNTVGAGASIKFAFEAFPFSGTLAAFKIPFFKPRTWSVKVNSVTGGPLMGEFEVFLDENRNIATDNGELTKQINQAFYQFDLTSKIDQILLDPSISANTVWDGSNYAVVNQNGLPDFRSGLIITRAASTNSVVDVITGLVNNSTYISRADLSIADTHWESTKNSALLDYIPASFSTVSGVRTSRWFDPINGDGNRASLSKLVPISLETAFKAAFKLPTGLSSNFNSVLRVYDAIARSASDPNTAPTDLLQQYAFETRIMLLVGLISRIYEQLDLQHDQLSSPNNPNGYNPEIYAYQVFPYLALTLQGRTHPYYRDLLKVVAQGVGTSDYASNVASGLDTGTYQLDLNSASDLALLLGFARFTIPHTGLGALTFRDGRLDISGREVEVKGLVQAMHLGNRAEELKKYMDAFDGIASTQFAADPLLVTTAVSPLKTALLQSNGVLDRIATAVSKSSQSSGVSQTPLASAFTPITPDQFKEINRAIQERTATSAVAPAVAGLSKAMTVEQTFGQSSPTRFEFLLRLSQPAPSGGAAFLLNYDGAAKYGIDYTIDGYTSQPRYIYIAAGETSRTLTVDVSGAASPSALLIELASGSGNYGISNGFNRLLLEIAGSDSSGITTLREQTDNVQLISQNGISQLVGENLFDGLGRASQNTSVQTVGTQPGIKDNHVLVSRYISSLDPTIVRLSASQPSNNEISGEWVLAAKDIFRANSTDTGLVHVFELRDPKTGRFTYAVDAAIRQNLASQGWSDLGVAFSLDANRSLPIGVESSTQPAQAITVPGFSLSGLAGYFDRYIFAEGQDISEWRFLAEVDRLAFSLGDQSFSLGGSLSLRERKEYGDSTFWLAADVDDFILPVLSTSSSSSPVVLKDADLAFRIFDPSGNGTADAKINQWRVAGSVSNLPVGPFVLNGSLDARYENSAATRNLATYWISAKVEDFDYTAGSLKLENLNVILTDLTLVDGEITAWTIDTSVTSLKLVDGLSLSGDVRLGYSVSNGKTRFTGDANLSDFDVNLGSNKIALNNGQISFALIDGTLDSWQVKTSVENLTFGEVITLSGTANLAYGQASQGTSLKGDIQLSEATLNLGTSLKLAIASGSINLAAVNGELRNFEAQAEIKDTNLGLFTIDTASAAIQYQTTVRGTEKTERVSVKIAKADINLDLGGGIPKQFVNDASLSLDIENGNILGFGLAADSVHLNLGNGITVAGSFSLLQETLATASGNTTRTFGSLEAEEINVALPGLNFKADGFANFTLVDKTLRSVNLFAQVNDLKLGTGPNPFSLDGFIDLSLSEFSQGAPGKVVLSSGIQDVALGLPGSNGATLDGEVKALTLIPQRDSLGQITGIYAPTAWELFGSIENFSIGGLFTADGYGRLAYLKDEKSQTENLKGKVEVSRFALTLPGSSAMQTAEISGSAAFDLDYLQDGQSRLNWFELTGGVKGLKLMRGFEISGDISLEYQGPSYSSNSLGQSRYIINAGINNSSFQISNEINLKLDEASLSDLVIASDGTVHSWELRTVVKELDLYGLMLSGDLDLAYDRAAKSLSGRAAITSFKLDLNGDGNSDLPDLGGAFSFKLIDNKLSEWDLTAKTSKAKLFDTFTFDGSINVQASISEDSGNTYKVNAEINDFILDLGSGNRTTLSGELRDLVILDRQDGRPFSEMVQSWKLVASEASLNLGNFSIKGAAEINYGYNVDKKREIKIKAKVDDLKLPTTLVAAGTLAGEINATLVDRYGTGQPELSAWSLQAYVKDLSVGGIELNGAINISYSEIDQGAIERAPYYEIDAQFTNLLLALPGSRELKIDSGRLNVGFFDSKTSANTSSTLESAEKFEIRGKVSAFKITDQLTLSGAISLAYANNLYRFNGNVSGLALPSGKSGQTFGGSVTDLVIAKNGEVMSWRASAFMENITLFGETTINGQADLSYSKEAGNERLKVSAIVKALQFKVPDIDVDVQLSGAISISVLNGQLENWTIAANLEGLKILEFGLKGELDLAYNLQDKLYFNQETIRLEKAAVSADVFGGLVSADVEVTDLLIANRNPWTAIQWQAKAAISIGQQANSSLPFALGGNLAIAYEHQNSKYNNASTYTLSGALDDFRFNGSYLSAGSVGLELEELVLSDGQIRSLDLSGSVEDLKIGNLASLSGTLGFNYFSDAGESILNIEGDLSSLAIGGYDLYKILGIKEAGIKAIIKNDSELEFTADISLQPDFKFSVAGLNFGFEKAGATVRYSTVSKELILDVNGRMQFGDKNPFPIEGSFSASINLDDGSIALRNASLLLTPDNKPVDFGLVRLDPGTQLNFSDNTLSLSADLAINAGLLDATAAPIYNFINTISPAVTPIVDTMSAKMPLDNFKTKAVDITIPAIKIPEIFISGYKNVFGIKLPTFGTRLKTIIPETKIELLPAIDLGKIATNYFENYYGNPYKGNGSVELIEVIDKVASELFKVNQLLARAGVGTAFEPYVKLYGQKAYTMPYPALAPFVKTLDSLLSIAKSGSKISNSGWVDLPAVALNYNLVTNKFGFDVGNGGDGLDGVLEALGGFGDLYSLVNDNPNVPDNLPKPIGQGLSGFVDRSSFKVPILDNPAKAIFDFILDKNIDLFEYNLDLAAGFQARAEIAISPAATVPFIGIPLPIVIGGNFGITAGVDATLGFSAPTKGIKAIGAELASAVTSGNVDLQKMISLLFNASTEANSGAYLVLDDQLVNLDLSASVDLGLDYKIAGIRGQLGFGTSLFGGLSLSGAGQNSSQLYERLYLNNLVRSIFEPDFANGRTPYDLNLGLKLGNTRVWTDLQFKAASPWMSLLRLETKLPTPQSGLKIKLGTIYTGPTFGSTKVFFDQNYDFTINSKEVGIFSGFRDGSADQDNLFNSITEQLLEDNLSGLLIVEPSADARDVMTGLSRSLALFDSITPSDRIPDALTVISSLQALPTLLERHQSPIANPEPTEFDETYLNGIKGFDELTITAASSYTGLADSDPAARELSLKQLRMEYQLQALLLATADYLDSFGVKQLKLDGTYPTLPQSEGLYPYLPVALYAQKNANAQQPFLDLTNTESLQAYFTFLNELVTASLGNKPAILDAAALLTGSLLADFNKQIDKVATATSSLIAPAEAPALALVSLKRLMQAVIFSSVLQSLIDDASNTSNLSNLLTNIFNTQLVRPSSSQIALTFAEAKWQATETNNEIGLGLQLDNPSSDIGASLSLLVSSTLVYGTDYTINGLKQLPNSLDIAAGKQSLNLNIERLSEKAQAQGDDSNIVLILLQGHSGIQIVQAANTLTVAADGSTTIGQTDLNVEALDSLPNVALINADANGSFAISGTSAGKQQILMGFDPLQGHHLTWTGSQPVPELQLVNGTLYAGKDAIAQVLSPTANTNGWQPLAYVNNAVLLGNTKVQTEKADTLTITEDTPIERSFNTLLDLTADFTVLAVSGDGQLRFKRNGNKGDSLLTINPEKDFSGSSTILVTIQEGTIQRTLLVPVTVTNVVDAPRQIHPLELNTSEDTPLTINVSSLTEAFLDPDRFDLVKFVELKEKGSQEPPSVTITFDHQTQTVRVTPAANSNGTQTLQLTVGAAAGEYTFDIKLNVAAVDDLSTGSSIPVPLTGTAPIALTEAEYFKPIDIDGDSMVMSRDGIRITVYPFAGELLWLNTKDTPIEQATILKLAEQRLITFDELNAGQLLYRHDGTSFDNELITDQFQYVLVQGSSNGAIISNPQVLVLVDGKNFDPNAPEEIIESTNDIDETSSTNQSSPLAPSISDFAVNETTNSLIFTFKFDQALQPETGSIRIVLATTPEGWGAGDLIQTLALSDPSVSFTPDGTSLQIQVETTNNPNLKGKYGYLLADFVSQGNVLKTKPGLSLVGNPSFYGTSVDFKPPALVDHSFINSGTSMVLQLNFSEPIDISEAASLQLDSVHAITGERHPITSLSIRKSGGNELLVDLSELVSNLGIIPGQRYAVKLDKTASLSDKHANAPNSDIEFTFELPFPNSPLFNEAKINARQLPETDLHLYFGLSSHNGQSIPVKLNGFGQADPILENQAATLSSHNGELNSGSSYNLSFNLFNGTHNQSQEPNNIIDWSSIDSAEATIRFNRNETWIDINQIEKDNLIGLSIDPADPQFVDLKIRFDRGANGWNQKQAGIQLGEVEIQAIPNESTANLPNSLPSVLVRSITLNRTSTPSSVIDISLPQLIISKTNNFDNQAIPLLLVASPSLTTQEDSEGTTGFFEVRSVHGLANEDWLTLSAEPIKGKVQLDRQLQTWKYVPNSDAFGRDIFTLKARDQQGAEVSRTVEILIENINDPVSGSLTIDIKRAKGSVTDRDPQPGDLLSVNTSALQDADGLGELKYQWFSIEGPTKTEIIGATKKTLLLTNSLIGKRVGAKVSYADGFGEPESVEQTLNRPVSEDGPTVKISNTPPTTQNRTETYFYQIELPGENSQAPRQLKFVTSGGSLVNGSFSIIPSSAVNTEAYTDLYLGQHAIDFELNAHQRNGIASAFIPLDIFGEGLQLQTGQKRRRLTYFNLDNSGNLSPLLYDPIKHRIGPRFYDLSGDDGIADHVHLTLKDGGYGDNDEKADGVIVDPSLAGSTDIKPQLSINSSVLTITDKNNPTATAALALLTALSGRSSTANQIRYIVLDQNEVARVEHLIDNLTFLKERSLNLFSTLESNDLTLPGGASFESEILLVSGESVVFFEVVDTTLETINSAKDSRLRLLNGSFSSGQATFSSISGVSFSLSLSDKDPGLSSLISQEQNIALVLDFTAFTSGESVKGSLVMGREAAHNSLIGFYRVVDRLGSVLDTDGISLLTPGIASIEKYTRAALGSANLVDELTGLRIDNNQSSSRDIVVKESTYIAPYAISNGNTFFAFEGANSDSFAYFRVLGNNLFGYEDQPGGGDRDFDDCVIGFNFSEVI